MPCDLRAANATMDEKNTAFQLEHIAVPDTTSDGDTGPSMSFTACVNEQTAVGAAMPVRVTVTEQNPSLIDMR